METSNNYSGENLRIPEIDNPEKRTLDEIMAEIREIINKTHWVQTRLSRLEANGYHIEECWVKNGSLEAMWYMKQKKALRIQVAESEPHGKYHKANCVIIPASDILFQEGDESRVRKLLLSYDANSDTYTPVTKKITENKKRLHYGTKEQQIFR